MLDFLVRKFVPDSDQVQCSSVRTAYGYLAGAMGIVLNFLLFCVKLPIGMLIGSIAITSDAFNNLSDMGSSLITVIGARMAGRRPDREHPFGHGRLEYISALIISFLILLVGFELLRQSFGKFSSAEPLDFNPVLIGILALSATVKLWMYCYNKKLGARIQSSVMRATASDSLNDAIMTVAVVLSTILGRFVSWPVDAIAGTALSLFILYSGFGIAKDTIDLLLGGKPDPQLVRDIRLMVMQGEGIVGMHDLIIHDYGPGRVMASVHAEIPADADIVQAHESIDATEQRIECELGVPIVIHMDPIVVNSARADALRDQVAAAVAACDCGMSFHDFRMTEGENLINLIFDLVVPGDMTPAQRAKAVSDITRELCALDSRHHCAIHVDEDYSGIC